jgi:hypothetical protein
MIRVDRLCATLNGLNYSLFIDNKSNALIEPDHGHQHSVIPRNSPLWVAQHRESKSQRFGERFVFGRTVDTNTNHLGAGGFELGDIRLIRLELTRSAAGESFYIKRQDHTSLALKAREPYLMAVLVFERKVRRAISHVQYSPA